MKKIKRFSIVAVVAVFVTLFSVLTAGAETYSGTFGADGDNLTWVLDDEGTLTISGEGEMEDFSSLNSPWHSHMYFIKNVIVEKGVTSIGDYAFYHNGFLESINLSDSISRIGNYIISNSHIESVAIPKSVIEIATYAFYDSNLKSISVDENNNYYSSDDNGVLFNKDKTVLIFYPSSAELITYIIPESVTLICSEAFRCGNLKNVIISENVNEIKDKAFYTCINLDSITIYNKEVMFGLDVFGGCSSDLKIFSHNPSAAKLYAIDYGIQFESIKTYIDFDSDDEITTADVQIFIKSLAGGSILSNEIADINGDTKINLLDLNYLFKMISKEIEVVNNRKNINLHEDWIVILENEAVASSNVIDGKLEEAYYLKVYKDNIIQSIKVKSIGTYTQESDYRYNDADTPSTVTPTTNYDFSEYVNKLATAVSADDGLYYFNLLCVDEFSDPSSLETDNLKAEYREIGEKDVIFHQHFGYRYYLGDKMVNEMVFIKPYTQVIIRSIDKNGDLIVSYFDYDNLPDISEDIVFDEASYVIVNNINSMRYENLAVFYGVVNGELKKDKGVPDEVCVGFSYEVNEEDGCYKYDVLNPFSGLAEYDIVGMVEGGVTDWEIGNMYAITDKGYIYDKKKFGNAFEVATNAGYYDIYDDPDGLGYVYVSSYDEQTGYLEIGKSVSVDSNDYEIVDNIVNELFLVTEETVVSFADKSAGGISVVDARALCLADGTYKQDSDIKAATRVFLVVEESENFDEDMTYIVKCAMIVRD